MILYHYKSHPTILCSFKKKKKKKIVIILQKFDALYKIIRKETGRMFYAHVNFKSELHRNTFAPGINYYKENAHRNFSYMKHKN